MKYEKPVVRLIGLDETAEGQFCSTGSGDVFCNALGNSAMECHPGATATSYCDSGNIAADDCKNGDHATTTCDGGGSL